MLHARAARLRAAVLTSLGLLPLGCGGEAEVNLADTVDQTLHTTSGEPSPEAPAPPVICEGSPLMAQDVNTGLVTCDSGLVHRPVPVECPNHLSQRAEQPATECQDESCRQSECQVDADCTERPYGTCGWRGQEGLRMCEYGCVTDADCGAEQACVCGQFIGECVSASCRGAQDCEAGYTCAQYRHLFGIGCGEPMQLACHTPGDQCQSPADCQGASGGNCDGTGGVWLCQDVPGVACGRPFLVEGRARLAPVAQRRDYALPLAPNLRGLDAVTRAQLSHSWLEIGQMEHASIAAFARFCLQLLELGAPHALLAAAQRAMADETEHIRLAFALASHYAGTPLGPGSLPMDGALPASQLEDVLALVLIEGCVGETTAALEAAEAAAHAEDPVVRGVLERIARDEQTHAELAWRFVAWALGERPELATRVERELASHGCTPAIASSPPPTPDGDLRRHGVSGEVVRAAVRAAAWRDVVRPCARRLLTQSGAATALAS